MELFIQTPRFNPELVDKVVYVLTKYEDGEEWQDGPYLVKQVLEDRLVLIDSQGRDKILTELEFKSKHFRKGLLVLTPEEKYTLEV
jgi:hypothetical protein